MYWGWSFLIFTILFISSCSNNERQYSGYVEGEFVFVSSAESGHLTTLSVDRGSCVPAKMQLFTLDAEPEWSELQQALDNLSGSEYKLANLIKAKRPDEISALEAQKAQAMAQMEFSKIEFERNKKLILSQAISQETYDESKALYDQNKALVEKLEADLRLAHLGARSDEIEEARANVEASRALVFKAQWKLDQKTVFSPNKGRIQDTFYRVGEWVEAGMPVVSLLPPENVKARFFVPEIELGRIKIGQSIKLQCDSCKQEIPANISFISQEAEFTVPIIYSRESRDKLVFMIEAKINPKYGYTLHPGQPLTILIGRD